MAADGDQELTSGELAGSEPGAPHEGSPLLIKEEKEPLKQELLGTPIEQPDIPEMPKKEEKIQEGIKADFLSWKVGGFLALYVLVTTAKVLTVKATFHVLGEWLMGALVFIEIGQASCLLPYFWEQSQMTEEEKAAQVQWDLWESDKGFFEGTVKWRLCLSSANELGKNLLFFYALTKLPASEVALFLGGDIIFVSLMNVFYRGRDMPLSKLVGVGFVFTAVLIEGVSHVIYGSDHKVRTNAGEVSISNPHFFAISLVILRSFLSACQQFVDERLTQTDKVPPVFIAGTHGFLIVPVMLLGMLLPWGLGDKYNLELIFDRFLGSPEALAFSFMLILTGAGDHYLNKLGLKNAGPLGRTVAKSCRPTSVWLFSLLLAIVFPFFGGERIHGVDSGLHAFALAVQFLGTMTYAGKSCLVEKDSACGLCAPGGSCYAYGPDDTEKK